MGEGMSEGISEEISFPDSADNLEVRERKTLLKQAEFWLKMHDVYERAAKVFVDIKNWMAHQDVPREPDERRYTQEEVRFLMDMTRRDTRRPGNNGDSGTPPWQLLTSVAAVLLTIGTMWGQLSDKITEQGKATASGLAALQTSVTDIKEKQREEHDRTTRLEEAVQRLSDERYARPNP